MNIFIFKKRVKDKLVKLLHVILQKEKPIMLPRTIVKKLLPKDKKEHLHLSDAVRKRLLILNWDKLQLITFSFAGVKCIAVPYVEVPRNMPPLWIKPMGLYRLAVKLYGYNYGTQLRQVVPSYGNYTVYESNSEEPLPVVSREDLSLILSDIAITATKLKKNGIEWDSTISSIILFWLANHTQGASHKSRCIFSDSPLLERYVVELVDMDLTVGTVTSKLGQA